MNSLDAESPIEEVAATVSEALAAAGITAVLSGGAAVQIYSEGLYVSRDLDFVSPAGHRELDAVLRKLGFSRVSGRHYVHDAAPYTLEFPPWPLAVGRELIRDWMELPVGRMTVRILTPTQCVMDRLAAFYFWRCHRASDTPQVRASDFPHPLTHRRVFRDHHIRVAQYRPRDERRRGGGHAAAGPLGAGATPALRGASLGLGDRP